MKSNDKAKTKKCMFKKNVFVLCSFNWQSFDLKNTNLKGR